MPLFEHEKSSCLMHMDYEVQGLYTVSPGGQSLAYGNMGMRFFNPDGVLLYRLNQLKPDEEARLTGRAVGAVGFSGNEPTPGDVVSITIGATTCHSSPITVSITVPPTNPAQPPYTLLTLAHQLSNALMATPAFIAAGYTSIADYGSGLFANVKIPIPVCSIRGGLNLSQFTITVAYTGTTVPYVTTLGQQLPPYIPVDSGCVWGYLPILDYLQAAIGGSTTRQAVAVSGTVKLRSDELEGREDLYERYKQMLSNFLGIPLNRKPASGAQSGRLTI